MRLCQTKENIWHRPSSSVSTTTILLVLTTSSPGSGAVRRPPLFAARALWSGIRKSPTTGPQGCRSRRPSWMCSKRISARSLMICWGRKTEILNGGLS